MKNNKKIGYFDPDIVTPVEVLLAADLLPIRLFGNPEVDLQKANEHIPPTHCVWARNILERALNNSYSQISGVITSHGCDCTNREFDIWLETVDFDFMYFLNVPLKRNKIARKFFVKDIKNMISEIEKYYEVRITPEKISKNIKLMNEIRALLKELSEYRSKYILKGSEFHRLVKMVQVTDRREALEKLKKEKAALQDKEPFDKDAYKDILLTGSVIDDTKFLEYLESLGLQVVCDDLCVGTRYFWNQANENGNPIKAVAEYYLSKPIYSTKFPSYKRVEFLKELIDQYNVDGVLSIAKKFCEPMLYDHPYMKDQFQKLGIPYTFIEMLYNRKEYKQLSTRFEAFQEMI
ncbi:MAG: 2-hydroxyacyl-CoA dehydratase family protein [Promethearchaeia archaeon]